MNPKPYVPVCKENPEGWNYDMSLKDVMYHRTFYVAGYNNEKTRKASTIYMHYRRQNQRKARGEPYKYEITRKYKPRQNFQYVESV